MKTPRRIKVIGLGGIGGALIEDLSRYIAHKDSYQSDDISRVCDIALIDGDKFEHRNANRQHFKISQNKAKEKKQILSELHPNILFQSVHEYVTEENVVEHIREDDVVFLCVDNHTTRRLVAERCEELENILLVSGGNDEIDGNIQVHVREDGKDKTPSILKYHPEIRSAEGDNPAEIEEERQGCEQQVKEDPQILFANVFAANLMSMTFRNWTEDRIDYGEVYFNINDMTMQKYTLEVRPA